MPQRWTDNQRKRSHLVRDLLLFVSSLAFTAAWFLLVIIDSESGMHYRLSNSIAEYLVGILAGTSTIIFGTMIVVRHKSNQKSHSHSRRAMLATRYQLQSSVTGEKDDSDIPIMPDITAYEQARQNDGRWLANWINAGIRLALGGAVPLIVHITNQLLEEPLVDDNAFFVVALCALGIGGLFAWDSWRVLLYDPHVSSDRTTLVGRTAWPMTGPRSLRMDRLVHIRCSKHLSGKTSIKTHFHLRDAHGTKVMVEAEPWVRVVLLAAIARQTGTRVSYLASRELAGMFTWWGPLLAMFELTVIMAISAGAAVTMATALGVPT
jgi:hypothetical protein